jgi:hypothetical protein
LPVGASERYLREWLANQAASNYLSYDPATRKFALPEEQAMIFAVEDNPVYLLGGFDLMAAMLDNQPKVEAAFRIRHPREDIAGTAEGLWHGWRATG